ncbi:MAG: hypothetical protein ABI361_08455 [Nitrososphaera sp.]|jgi:hypothetical protein
MAVLVFVTGEGFTKEMYETVRKEVDWEHKHPQGGVFHGMSYDAAKKTVRIADVWESEGDFKKFVDTRLQPVFQKLKYTPPKFEVFPAHNINAYPSIEKHKLK